MVFQAGEIILDNTYRVEGLAGKGAFGEVYRVTHLKLNSTRAIKVLRTDSLIPQELQKYRDRFQVEAQLTDYIKHPNVVQVYDFIEKGGVFYLVMEYLEDGTLRDKLNAKKQLSIEETISLALNLCDGLAAIHRADVVHRDLHPRNILFDSSGAAKIADLGVAQFPGRSLTYGTSQPGDSYYQSPEQEHNVNHLYPTSDIFSLGCVLFEALTGKKYKTVFGARVRDHRRDIPKWLDEIVTRALIEETSLRATDDTDPCKRYRMVESVEAAIAKGQAAFDWAVFFKDIVQRAHKLWREFWQVVWWLIKKLGPAFTALLVIIAVAFGASKWIETNNVSATQTAVYIASIPTVTKTPTRTAMPTSVPTSTSTPTQAPTATVTFSPTPPPSISGRVIWNSFTFAGAKVELVTDKGSLASTIISDSKGFYSFVNIAKGNYLVRVVLDTTTGLPMISNQPKLTFDLTPIQASDLYALKTDLQILDVSLIATGVMPPRRYDTLSQDYSNINWYLYLFRWAPYPSAAKYNIETSQSVFVASDDGCNTLFIDQPNFTGTDCKVHVWWYPYSTASFNLYAFNALGSRVAVKTVSLSSK